MSGKQPVVTTNGPRSRKFVTTAVAVQAVIVNQARQLLLLRSPGRKQGWQTVSGALEAGETVLAGTWREISEEIGSAAQVRPLGTVHIESFHYDTQVQFMLGSYYLFAYLGGAIVPGDDMTGSEYRWWPLAEIEAGKATFHETAKPWLLRRAVHLYDLWKDEVDVPLQLPLASV